MRLDCIENQGGGEGGASQFVAKKRTCLQNDTFKMRGSPEEEKSKILHR